MIITSIISKNKNMSEGIAMLSKIRFGVALPQGWSYDLSGTASTADLELHQRLICNKG
jgi:hypothetical protein